MLPNKTKQVFGDILTDDIIKRPNFEYTKTFRQIRHYCLVNGWSAPCKLLNKIARLVIDVNSIVTVQPHSDYPIAVLYDRGYIKLHEDILK